MRTAIILAFFGLALRVFAIESGETLSSVLLTPTQTNSHSFYAQAGDTVQLRMTTADGSSVWPNMALRAPGGQLLKSSGSIPGSVDLTHTLAGSGQFTVYCQSAMGGTGNYNIAFLRLPGYPLSQADADIGGITNGQTLMGRISPKGDHDAVTFEAAAGDTIQIRMTTQDGSSVWPGMELWSPGGVMLNTEGSIPGYVDMTHTFEENGLYTVICKSGMGGTGGYNVAFLRLTGYPLSASDPDGGVIGSGETLRGTLAPLGDLDSVTFTAEAGDTVFARMTSLGNVWPSMEIWSPSGELVGSDQTLPGYSLELTPTLEESGLYTIICKDDWDETGSYSVNFGLMPPGTGGLTLSLKPASAVGSGGRWAVDGGVWRESGAMAFGLSAGPHVVSFKALAGYVKPATRTVVIQDGALTPASGDYVKIPLAGVLSLVTNACTVREGEVVWIAARRYGGFKGPASVSYITKPGSALARVDYVPKSGSLYWRDGEGGTKTIGIAITKDGRVEGPETFMVALSRPVGAPLVGSAKATVMIQANQKGGSPSASELWTPMDNLTDALDESGLAWLTSPFAPWTAQRTVTSDRVDAAVSGAAEPGRVSWLQADVEGPGSLEFDWRVRGAGLDACLLLVDGEVSRMIGPGGMWVRETIAVGPGSHTLRWVFTGEYRVTPGAAYLDCMTWREEKVGK